MAMIRVVVKMTEPVAGFRCETCGVVRPGGAPNICLCVARQADVHVAAAVYRPAYIVHRAGEDMFGDSIQMGPWELVG